MSNDKHTLQEAWRLGHRLPDGFTIPAASIKHAARIRFALYNATKAFRNGAGTTDEELRAALDNCQITISDNGVTIQAKVSTDISRAVEAALGRPARSVEDYESEASLARLMGKLEDLAVPEPEQASLTITQQTASKYGARHL